ncbi:ribonuclease H-like domain-containing protein, partial [bacterium]|nr:ribonuclease H-like domain-containing protein [bacterium]
LRVAAAPVPPAPPTRRPPRCTPLDRRAGSGADGIDGAELCRIGGQDVCVVRRDVEDLLPGHSLTADLADGLAALAERDAADIYPGLRPLIGFTLDDIVVLDLETTGFWGCPVFLSGMLYREEGRLVSMQILARDYPEEPAMLAAASALLKRRKVLVTFNGKSYDAPCFAERCSAHRIRTGIRRMAHVDVLHASRRRWKDELPDCRLQTLEWEVVGLHRTGDIPSAEIPGVYHAYAASRDPEELHGVLHHGRVDVVTTASLLARLLEDPPAPCRPPRKRRKREGDADDGSRAEPGEASDVSLPATSLPAKRPPAKPPAAQ